MSDLKIPDGLHLPKFCMDRLSGGGAEMPGFDQSWQGPTDRNPSPMLRMRPGWVYLVQLGHDGMIKIGFSSNPAKRLRSINQSCGDTLRLLGILRGSMWDEADLHRRFASRWICGEWFYPHIDFVALLNEPGWVVGYNATRQIWPQAI